jgi:thioredoxin-dependent peroxiredoxin
LKFEIYGISRDSLKSHEKFKEKFKFPFDLISDENEIACKHFDVIKEKNMYGKKVWGIERSTFVIHNGTIVHEWRKLKAEGHAAIVLDFVKSL